MSYKESDIVHENGGFWVLRDRKQKAYAVYASTDSHYSICDSAYRMDDDGLSIAKVRCNYLAARSKA